MSTTETNTQEKNTVVAEQKKTNESSKTDTGKRPSNFSDLNREIHALIIDILRTYASEQHPLSPAEILQYINKKADKLPFLGEKGSFNMTLKTVRVHLDSMYKFCRLCETNRSSLFVRIYFGRIHRYHLPDEDKESTLDPSRQNSFGYIRDNGEKNLGNRKTFYSFESVFHAQDLLLLQSCVETNPYISPRDSRNILRKIRILSERSYKSIWEQKESRIKNDYRESLTLKNPDPNSGKLMQNLTDLICHIEMNHQIIITYGMYDYDFNSPSGTNHIVLVPKRHTDSNQPRSQIIDPVAVLWANGFCYLVAHTPKSKSAEDVIVYRVDRIISIEPSRDSQNKIITIGSDVQQYKEKFDSLEYLKKHPVMYSGDSQTITMLVKNTERFPIVNLLYDTFGKNIEIHNFISEANSQKYMHCSRAELKERGEIWYTVVLNNYSVQGTVLWAKQHIDLTVIVSPPEAVELLTNSVREGLARYQ